MSYHGLSSPQGDIRALLRGAKKFGKGAVSASRRAVRSPAVRAIAKRALPIAAKAVSRVGPLGAITIGTGAAAAATRAIARRQRVLPGGARLPTTDTEVMLAYGGTGAPQGFRRKRRKMNPANAKALTRAGKRIDAFVRLATTVTQNTRYKVVSRTAGGREAAPKKTTRRRRKT